VAKWNSPRYKDGTEDGLRDTALIMMCPPVDPVGPNPPDPAYPVMYTKGYEDNFHPELRHQPCKNCKEK
jgi:hypothetical protein